MKKYFIFTFLSIFVLSFLVFYIFEIQVRDIKLEELKENEVGLIDFQNKLIGEEFRIILGDLHYLHHVYDEKLVDGNDMEIIAKDWVEFSNQRRIYDQIRFLDKSGDEIIRINYNGNEASLIEDYKLQNKKERYYFQETEVLENEKVFVSPLDLNIENGEIEKPYKPMVRFSTPLYDEKGEFHGIIMLNYLADTMLKNFKELSKNSKGQNMLLNSDGYWLSSVDEGNEWNFMFEDKKDKFFAKIYPEEWEQLKDEKGQIISENGLFTFEKVHLNHNYIQGENFTVDENIIYADSNWHIISLISTDNEQAAYFSDNFFVTIKGLFKKNFHQLILVAVFSGIISFFVYLNRKKYYQIKFFSEYDPLTKTLNRRAGYSKIDKMIYKNDKRHVLFSLCFIDVNGLKNVNDNLGHEDGDELLTTVCDIIKKEIRDKDFLIRQGGDEFLLIFNDIDIEQSEKIWKRIVSKFEKINNSENRAYTISVSHGIVQYNNAKNIKLDELIQEADDKMYQEKKIIKKNLQILR